MNICKVEDLKVGMVIKFAYGMEDNIVEVEVTGVSRTNEGTVSVTFLINSRIETISVNVDSEFEVVEKAKNINELEILVNETPALIDHNFTEVKASLSAMMKGYEGLTYTEDTVTDARNDVSTLRKIRKAIDDKRKEVKKAHMIPYEEFEAKAKELCEIIDGAIEPINKQIDEYSELKKKEKKAKILEYFNSQIGELDFITFEDVFNEKWISNMSTAMKSIKVEIDEYINTVNQDVATIKSFGSEVEEKALSAYKATKRLADSINIINNYEKQKAEILAREEARRKAEEDRKQQEEIRRKQEEERKEREAEEARLREEERKRQEEIERIRVEEREKARKEYEKKAALEATVNTQSEIIEQADQSQQIDVPKISALAQGGVVTPFINTSYETTPCYANSCSFTTFRINASSFEISMIEEFLIDNEIEYTKL